MDRAIREDLIVLVPFARDQHRVSLGGHAECPGYRRAPIDLEGMKKSMGLENDVEALTHRELQKRRKAIGERLDEARPQLLARRSTTGARSTPTASEPADRSG